MLRWPFGQAGRLVVARRIGERDHQDGVQRRIVVVPAVVVDDAIHIDTGAHCPGGAQVAAEVAHAPVVFQKPRRAHLNEDTKGDDGEQEQAHRPAFPAVQRGMRDGV